MYSLLQQLQNIGINSRAFGIELQQFYGSVDNEGNDVAINFQQGENLEIIVFQKVVPDKRKICTTENYILKNEPLLLKHFATISIDASYDCFTETVIF